MLFSKRKILDNSVPRLNPPSVATYSIKYIKNIFKNERGPQQKGNTGNFGISRMRHPLVFLLLVQDYWALLCKSCRGVLNAHPKVVTASASGVMNQ